jgi:hypothetical protein
LVGRLAQAQEEVEEGLFRLVVVVEEGAVAEEEACWVTEVSCCLL